MTAEFSELVTPIFLRVLDAEEDIRADPGANLPAHRDAIRAEIAQAASQARSGRTSVRPEDFDLARRGLVYWADEILTFANPRWNDATLEHQEFNDFNRAVRFYEFGEREARHAHPDVAEVWYLALALGFEGKIIEAFSNGLGVQPPGGPVSPGDPQAEQRAKRAWAADLHRIVRRSTAGEGPPEPDLYCDTAPLRGGVLLGAVSRIAALVAVIGVGLSVCLYWLG